MASNQITRLARLEGRAIAIRDQVFSTWIEQLPDEDLFAVVERADEEIGPMRPCLESWLIGTHPAPDIRPDLWRQAVWKVLELNGIDDSDQGEESADSQTGEPDR